MSPLWLCPPCQWQRHHGLIPAPLPAAPHKGWVQRHLSKQHPTFCTFPWSPGKAVESSTSPSAELALHPRGDGIKEVTRRLLGRGSLQGGRLTARAARPQAWRYHVQGRENPQKQTPNQVLHHHKGHFVPSRRTRIVTASQASFPEDSGPEAPFHQRQASKTNWLINGLSYWRWSLDT